MSTEVRDDLPRLVEEYRHATYLESVATREEDKTRLRKIRSFLLAVMGIVLSGVVWH